MKDNTNQVKDFLMKALTSLPNDFVLADVKIDIKNAISKIEKIEHKRAKKEENYQARKQESKKYKTLSTNDMLVTLEVIDDLIKAEKLKLEEIKNKKTDNLLEG